MTESTQRLRVLCVDDDPAVLEGLELSLFRHFDVVCADSGEDALRRLWQTEFAVVVSDMRMPGMSGAALLAEVRERFPDTTRLLLTGYTDVEAAAMAVNEGQIFRFLTKPCPPQTLLRAVQDAAAHHRLLTAERELLERTLRGAVSALAEVLALSDPEAYGRAGRVQKLALALAHEPTLEPCLQPLWPLELAALLAPLGRVSLPAELLARQARGEALGDVDKRALQLVPEVTDRLLASIPRLEPVRDLLRIAAGGSVTNTRLDALQSQRGGEILRLATDCVELEACGDTSAVALAQLRTRRHDYGEALFAALERIRGEQDQACEIRSLPAKLLKVGMVLCDDLMLQAGQRLVPRGFEVTAGLVERLRNLRPGSLKEPVRVMLPAASAYKTTADQASA